MLILFLLILTQIQTMSDFENVSEYVSSESVDEEEEQTESQPAEFVSLKEHDDYEILTVYPFTIRRKDNHYEVKESLNHGYPRVKLNCIDYRKHRIIALQFLPNPNNYNEVDHISRDRTDYHIENLRWVSRSSNQKNKSSHKGVEYEYVKELPQDAMKVLSYNQHEFEDDMYYFHDDVFYFNTGIEYRKMIILETQCGSKYVKCINKQQKQVSVLYRTFKTLNGL